MRTSGFLMTALFAAFGLSGATMTTGAAEIEPGLPPNTVSVLTLNIKQLLHAPTIKAHSVGALRQAFKNSDAMRQTMEALGLDPFRDLDRLTLAIVGQDEKGACLLIVRGRFDTARFHNVVGQLAKVHSDRLTAHKANGLKYYSLVSHTDKHGTINFNAGASSTKGAQVNMEIKGGTLLDLLGHFGGTCLTLANKTTLVVAPSEEMLKKVCNRLAGKGDADLSKRMRQLLTELDGKQTITFAAAPTGSTHSSATGASSEAQEESHASPFELSGSIAVAEDFKLLSTLRAVDTSVAKAVMKNLKDFRLRMDGLAGMIVGGSKECAFLKEIPRSFLAVRKGPIILIEGHLSAELLAKLLGTKVHVKGG